MKYQFHYILISILVMIFLFYVAGNFTTAQQTNNTTVYQKLADGQNIQYLIIGDSIGRGARAETDSDTWFAQLERLLQQRYGIAANRTSVVQSGATTFEGIYKFQETTTPDRVDLAFIVFGENDRKYMDAAQFSYFYEQLIRQIKLRYPAAEIFTLTESCLKQEPFAREIQRLSDYYHATNVDMRIPFQHSQLPVSQLTADMVHPNGKGYALYANEIANTLDRKINENADISVLQKPFHNQADVRLEKQENIIANHGFTYKDGFYFSNHANDYLEYEFTGPLLGVTLLRSETGGTMNVFIDGKFVRTISTWWPFERKRHLYVSSQLGEGPHVVRFVVTGQQAANLSSLKPAVQISSIIAANTN